MLVGQFWGSAVFVFQSLINSFLAGVWNALSRICILKCPLKILSAAFSVSSLLPVMWLRIQYCGYGTAAKRPWRKFMGHYRVHIQNRGLSAYDVMLQQARLLLVPQCLVLNPRAPSGELLSVDGCQIFVVEKSFKNDRCLMLPWCWHHSFINLILNTS